MAKIKIKVDRLQIKKTGSSQNFMATRMPARTYENKKKQASKNACRAKFAF